MGSRFEISGRGRLIIANLTSPLRILAPVSHGNPIAFGAYTPLLSWVIIWFRYDNSFLAHASSSSTTLDGDASALSRHMRLYFFLDD